MSRQIPLTQGLFAIVDDDDYPDVSRFKWCASKAGDAIYAVRGLRKDGRRTTVSMHRYLTGLPLTDHVNGNGLDNRRSNLREANKAQNSANSRSRTGTSRYRGVSWLKTPKRWRAVMAYQDESGKRHTKHLGHFKVEEDAARAYDAAAREHWGTYACLNFPEPGERSALKEAA